MPGVEAAVAHCDCGAELAPGLLVCPACHRLVHASDLARLKQNADAAATAGDAAAEIAAWREASALVPDGSRQQTLILEKIAALAPRADVPAQTGVPTSGWWKWLGGLGPLGIILWKFKFLIVLAATKGKLLLLGLTKASTFFSMFLAFGVYWTTWGMWFALGFVLSIYVHEMGHIAAIRRFGLEATAPMFVPGLGAFIRLRGQHLAPYENARIGLAGPLWGLGAAAVALAVHRLGGGPIWAAIAHTGAWLNLFNLLPVWQLDGSRGFSALSKHQRAMVVAAFALAWMISGDGLLILLAIVAVVRVFEAGAPQAPDRGALALFLFLIASLAAIFHFAPAPNL